MGHYRIPAIFAAIAVAGALVYPLLFGGSSGVPDEQLQEIVYVDRESGETFLLRARLSPEYHPETGEPTLIPGMYCEKCRAWKAAGPLEMLQTSRIQPKCSVHKTPLLREGPLPDEL